MSWIDEVSHLAERYVGSGGAAPAPEASHEDYKEAAQRAPQEEVAGGLAKAFRSDRTPPFPEMVANLFRNSNSGQKAGLLNRLLTGIGPGAMAGLPRLASMLGGGGEVRPEQADRVSPEDAQQLAAHAEKQNPSVIDEVSSFYSRHPDVVKAVGGLAMGVALQHILRRR